MSISHTNATQRRRVFRELHVDGCFVMPNPWDRGSARYLEGLGFKALASTSAGVAWSHAKPDGAVHLEETLAHLEELLAASSLPVNADFESGFATDPAGVAQNVRRAIDIGVSGLSIEDSTGHPASPLRDLASATERMRAARVAIDEAGGDTVLVGRAENFIVGMPDLDDTIRRLRAYSEAGADVLYAPGLKTREHIEAVVAAVAPKPVNMLIGWESELTLAEVQAMGVRRVSVGGALARAAWGGFCRAAQQIAVEGRFNHFAGAASGSELNAFFAAQAARSESHDDVRAGMQRFEAAYNRQDAAGLASVYAERAKMLPNARPMLVGRPAIQAYWQTAFDHGLSHISKQVVDLVSRPDLAIETSTYVVTVKGRQVKGKDVLIWRRGTDGGWEIESDIWNDDQ